MHRREFERAADDAGPGRAASARLTDELRDYQDLYWAGYVQDAQKEYVEANATYRAVRGEPLPDPGELGVAAARSSTASARRSASYAATCSIACAATTAEGCEALLQIMDDMYSLLVTVDYPDALTGGLRRTTDNVRGILERTRGDLTSALRQRELQAALRQLESRPALTPAVEPDPAHSPPPIAWTGYDARRAHAYRITGRDRRVRPADPGGRACHWSVDRSRPSARCCTSRGTS